MAITVEKKYGALRIIATVLKIVGLLVLLFGVIGGILAVADGASIKQTNPEHGLDLLRTGLVGLISAIVGAICLWAWAELIKLFIDVEENTRKTHILLERERD
jgi:hypothetical protein